MSADDFFRRALGGAVERGVDHEVLRSTPSANRADLDREASWWFDIPQSGGYFELDAVVHQKDELARFFPPPKPEEEAVVLDTLATLHRDPSNPNEPNAVEVRIEGWLAGYIPHEHAAAWNAFVARLELEGFVPRASVHLWIAHHYWSIHLRARPDADYRTPGELDSETGRDPGPNA
jgi:hypothetical protein